MTIVEAMLFQYVWFSVTDMLGWLNGVIIKKLNVTEPITSRVFAAMIGTVESPWRVIRFEPTLGLILESNATPRPTICFLDPA